MQWSSEILRCPYLCATCPRQGNSPARRAQQSRSDVRSDVLFFERRPQRGAIRRLLTKNTTGARVIRTTETHAHAAWKGLVVRMSPVYLHFCESGRWRLRKTPNYFVITVLLL